MSDNLDEVDLFNAIYQALYEESGLTWDMMVNVLCKIIPVMLLINDDILKDSNYGDQYSVRIALRRLYHEDYNEEKQHDRQ